MQTILVTGASSGIGAALAKEAATRPGAKLVLVARNETRLAETAAACRALGAEVCTEICDVTRREEIRRIIERHRPKIVIANAGVATGEETEENARRTFETNIGGVVNTVFPAIDCRAEKIVIVSSMTAYHGMASCPSYAASKAAVKAWGAGLRGFLAPKGIAVVTVCPGFVRSGITDKNTFKMPFFMESDEAAHIIWRGIDRNRPLVSFPWPMRFAAWLGSILPERLAQKIYSRLPAKSVPPPPGAP